MPSGMVGRAAVFLVVVFLGADVFVAVVVLVAAVFFAAGFRGVGFFGPTAFFGPVAFFVAAFQPVSQPMQRRSSGPLFVRH
ncbi:hypothetical protein PUR34_32445 [Streptomyces sp. JV185]|uniref:hypothetical protein n=1 Tax=Streptomyces sp. JV185 TaxID=858638 RepID=UPI002E77B0A5|nr:hypothetical protein [Streptomyces sp. JV185]MEE1772741.1 hypothetical protein [Streptomyces sp. JV185]